jgi:xylitol oxidase
MHKRDFLKGSAAAAASLMFSNFEAQADTDIPRTNWSGNYLYSTDKVFEPATTAEVQDAVRSVQHLRALGTRHAFNGIADSTTAQLSTHRLTSVEIDSESRTATVGAGIRYGELALALDARGFALHNLASLPHISVGGAVATATHGSGLHNGNLSTAVQAIEFVSADGAVHTLSRAHNPDIFPGAVVALGALGIVTRITLAVEPTYQMTQIVYQNLPFSELEHNLPQIMSAAYSVSLFTDWQNSRASTVWLKRRVDQNGSASPAATFHQATLATKKLHPIPDHPAEACTDQLNIPGPCRTSNSTSPHRAARRFKPNTSFLSIAPTKPFAPSKPSATASPRTSSSPSSAPSLATTSGFRWPTSAPRSRSTSPGSPTPKRSTPSSPRSKLN